MYHDNITMPVLTRNGYIIEEDKLTESHIRELTVTPRIFDPDEPIRSFEVFEDLQNGTIAVPRYWANEKFGRAEVFYGRVYHAFRLVFEGNLRSAFQEEASQRCVNMLQNHGGGILCLPTGTGKTVIALHVACVLGVKTLVIVHKQFLMDQWADRIKQFVPSARVGRLQQKTIDVDGCDLVVGMLQSVAMHQYDPDVFEGFGLVIFDEVHVVPAPVMSRALLKLCSPCMLGVSATPERRDGLSYVTNWFIGPVFMQHMLTGMTKVHVHAVPVKCNIVINNNRRIKITMIENITRLCNNPERNRLLVRTVNDLVKDGKKVILLSDRRAHCILLRDSLANDKVSCALYLGMMKKDELKESETKDVLLATYAMAKEGLDIPNLDALVLATPRSDVIQACGRVLHGEGKKPIIIDIVDQWCIGRAQFNKRLIYYSKAGFTIKQF